MRHFSLTIRLDIFLAGGGGKVAKLSDLMELKGEKLAKSLLSQQLAYMCGINHLSCPLGQADKVIYVIVNDESNFCHEK